MSEDVNGAGATKSPWDPKRSSRRGRISAGYRSAVTDEPIHIGDFFSGLPAVLMMGLAMSSLAWARFAPESRIRAYEKQADARVFDAADGLSVCAAHQRILLKVARLGSDVGTDIAHHDRTVKGREDDGDARAHDARQQPHAQLPRRHARAGVAGADDDIRLTLPGQLAHHADRAIGLRADGVDRRLIHLDHFGRGHDLVERFFLGIQPALRQALADDAFVADQKDLVIDIEQGRGFPAAVENGRRSLVTAHHIYRCSQANPP